METEIQYCTFYVDNLLFGIEVCQVQEVLREQTLTHVPLANHAVEGLINLRGQIVTAIDLRRRFEMPERDSSGGEMNVVVNVLNATTSLIVDRVGDVLTLPSDSYEAAPETLRGIGRELITGAYKLDDRLLLILDAQRAVAIG